MIFRVIKGIRVARYWLKAVNLTAKDQNEEARCFLIKIENFDPKNFPEVKLLLAFNELKLENFKQSWNAIKEFQKEIEYSSVYTWDDKNYMLSYANRILDKIGKAQSGLELRFLGDPSKICLEKVSDRVRSTFPLPNHVDYRDYIENKRLKMS